ncbi:xanthine dehydrogenase family protein molybdopterin-binding subunit [Variovorax saccharolyticus]|uniref:xanthine dehydrogenase family protein molybdopterin-binding subunit n=1 Tax=Variovorax saccharolyticus TaxID=3053516 RepID=UPI0025749170|nr:xanthine dehydrogenase family protein molybdopterin-binding subunit [Variovorax sp. J31P216]MDM0029681.1 xanthine dehydrogenase family protein molybdopterin-binding subunit [Variovorax sp. J31P216]
MIHPSSSVKIGDAFNRVDGFDKVTGRARYAAEFDAPDLLHGWVVSSDIAKGKIAAIDEAAARAVAGVVEVITHQNRPHVAWLDRSHADEVSVPGSPFRALYDDEIAFSGQPIALVVATTLEAAREAAALVHVDYIAAPHNTDMRVALGEKFKPRKKRSTFVPPKARGDAKAAFAAAPLKHSADYTLPMHFHNPMEMHATTVVWKGDGTIVVHDKTQGAQNVQHYLCSVFGFSAADVRVMNPYVGGAFGSGLRPQYQVYLATLAATMLERSVRVVLTRQQMFTHVHRPQAVQSVQLATDASGLLQAIVNDATTSTSRFENYMEVVCNWGLMNYRCGNAAAAYTLAPMDTYTPGDMRAPGAATGMTLFEIAIDEMAYRAGLDPLAFRRLNYSDVDAMNDKPFTSKSLRQAYDEGAERFGWHRRSHAPRSMRAGCDLIGWGMATGMWDALFMKTTASARLLASGELEVATAAADIGTGTYTVMAQVASDTLGLPLSQIRARLGDSALPASPVEGGSWMAASAGAAVQLACQAIGQQLLAAADRVEGRPLGQVKLEAVEFHDGRMSVRGNPARSVAILDILAASGQEVLAAQATAKPGVGDLISMKRKARNTHSAIFAEVRVDEELGVVRVSRIVCAVAAGRIINPKTARSQILGGVVMGIGMALHEEALTDHRLGRVMNHSFAEYHIPVNADIDTIEVIFVDEPDPEVTPLGVKGLGEIGIVGTAAAVANAIFHATGKRVRALPVTIDKLL